MESDIEIIRSNRKFKPTQTQLIAFSFFAIIVIGGLLLTLPISSRSREWTPLLDALFTATSATCVTGLIVRDTYLHWSTFGQIVIIVMIQIGGLGLMSIITMFSVFLKRRISLHERKLLMQSAGNTRISGIVQMLKRIIIGTFTFEGCGAVILATRFCPIMGLGEGIYNAVFHSVSAFCNAGFDLMGKYEAFSSLTHFKDDVVVNLTIMGLIVVGGIGFLVWSDVVQKRLNFSKYSLHSKIALCTTALLLVSSTILFMIFERDTTMAGASFGQRLLYSAFQAVTPRTAGFNTISQADLSESGSLLTTILMLIGGNPGSTAGGIKTTTLAVLIVSIVSSARGNSFVTLFKRRFEDDTLRQAASVATVYVIGATAATMIICALEPFNIKNVLFEVASAIGTVGITQGITTELGPISHIILMLLMYSGRIGGLTLMLLLTEGGKQVQTRRPAEKILIG